MKVILIITKGSIDMTDNPIFEIMDSNKKQFSKILEIEEQIDMNGDVLLELRESAINDLLRKVFSERPDALVIALRNSNHNPVHEKSLQNILNTAGYRSIYVSSNEEQLISFLSAMFAKSMKNIDL